MSFKRLSVPVALVAFVALFESPLALASTNTTRWRNFAQDPSGSDFTVSPCSELAPTYIYEADGDLGVQCVAATKRYEQSRRPTAAEDKNPDLGTFLTQTSAHRVSTAVYPDSSAPNLESVTPTTGSANALRDGAESIVWCLVSYSHHRVVWYPDL